MVLYSLNKRLAQYSQKPEKLIVPPQTSHTHAFAAPLIKTSSTQTDENITKIKCPPLNYFNPFHPRQEQIYFISTPDASTSSSSPQAQSLPSTSSISTSNPESQPPIPTCTDALLPTIWSPLLNHLPPSYQLPHHSPLFNNPDSNTVQMPRNLQKHDRGKKKRITKKKKRSNNRH
ncbi:hypothetical protein TNCV_1635121 [Trichonephila clavipes]|nr:hypothetical protein TNCV_1635121 [Trichonephila clavipes]